MTVLDYAYTATFTMLALGVLCALVRLVRGPSVLDRIIGLNTISVLLVSLVAVEVASRGDTAYVGLMISIALLGFVATVTAARFAERRAHDRS